MPSTKTSSGVGTVVKPRIKAVLSGGGASEDDADAGTTGAITTRMATPMEPSSAWPRAEHTLPHPYLRDASSIPPVRIGVFRPRRAVAGLGSRKRGSRISQTIRRRVECKPRRGGLQEISRNVECGESFARAFRGRGHTVTFVAHRG